MSGSNFLVEEHTEGYVQEDFLKKHIGGSPYRGGGLFIGEVVTGYSKQKAHREECSDRPIMCEVFYTRNHRQLHKGETTVGGKKQNNCGEDTLGECKGKFGTETKNE